MDKKTPNEEHERQQPVHDQSTSGSNSDDGHPETSNNPTPAVGTLNHLTNGTADGTAIVPEESDLRPLSATTNSTEGDSIAQMEPANPFLEEIARQQEAHDQHSSSSYSDVDQFETVNNPALTEGTANFSVNGTVDAAQIIPVSSDFPVTSAAIDSSFSSTHLQTPTGNGHRIVYMQEPNPMPHNNAMYVIMVNEPSVEETVGDEHDERNLIVPMPL
mgnify:CR=1 FL=1